MYLDLNRLSFEFSFSRRSILFCDVLENRTPIKGFTEFERNRTSSLHYFTKTRQILCKFNKESPGTQLPGPNKP